MSNENGAILSLAKGMICCSDRDLSSSENSSSEACSNKCWVKTLYSYFIVKKRGNSFQTRVFLVELIQQHNQIQLYLWSHNHILYFVSDLPNNQPACAVQHGSVGDVVYDACGTAMSFAIVNKLRDEWIMLSANVSFSLGAEQEGSVSYLSKPVLYPFAKHTWKINIDVSQHNSFGFTLCSYSSFIPPIYCINI